MKKFLFIIAIFVAGCSHPPPGWGNADATMWANDLGYPNVKETCVEYYDILNQPMNAFCSVSIDNHIYNIICYSSNNQCILR